MTEAKCGYVTLSKLKRYYLCPEFDKLPTSDYNDYKSDLSPLDDKYECHFVFNTRQRRVFH